MYMYVYVVFLTICFEIERGEKEKIQEEERREREESGDGSNRTYSGWKKNCLSNVYKICVVWYRRIKTGLIPWQNGERFQLTIPRIASSLENQALDSLILHDTNFLHTWMTVFVFRCDIFFFFFFFIIVIVVAEVWPLAAIKYG